MLEPKDVTISNVNSMQTILLPKELHKFHKKYNDTNNIKNKNNPKAVIVDSRHLDCYLHLDVFYRFVVRLVHLEVVLESTGDVKRRLAGLDAALDAGTLPLSTQSTHQRPTTCLNNISATHQLQPISSQSRNISKPSYGAYFLDLLESHLC